MLRNNMSGTIMPIFIFGRDCAKLFFWQLECQTFFWQPKPLLAVGTRELVAFILGSIFLAVKSVFGRILPKIKVGTISAKNKSWQTQSFFLLFARTHCYSLCMATHTTHTTEKHTKSTTHLTTHPTHYTHHTLLPSPSPSPGRRRRS